MKKKKKNKKTKKNKQTNNNNNKESSHANFTCIHIFRPDHFTFFLHFSNLSLYAKYIYKGLII